MPDKNFDILIQINSRAEGMAAAQAQIADLRANIDAANVSAAEGNASFEQQAALQGEINAMIGIRRELLEAQLTGNEAAVQLARAELSVHAQTLATLRSESLSHEAINTLLADQVGLLELAATQTTEVAAAGSLVGINYSKAKFEAMQFGREVATGTVTMRTQSALLGAFGPQIAVAGIFAYGFYGTIKSWAEEGAKFNKELLKIDEQLGVESRKWGELNKLSITGLSDSGDISQIGEKITSDLAAAESKFDQFRFRELSAWKKFEDTVAVGLAKALGIVSGDVVGGNQAEQDRQLKLIAELEQRRVEQANEDIDLAQTEADTWKKIHSGVISVDDAIADYANRLWTMQELQSGVDRSTASGLEIWQEYGRIIEFDAKAIEKLQEIRRKDDTAEKHMQQEQLNAALRQQAELLEEVRQKQQLISADPFLSAGAKQSLSLQSMRNEYQALQEAITADRGRLQGGTLDPQTYERVNQEMKRLEFESNLLHHKMQALTFGGELQADIAKWVNGWGTAAHQIAGTITSSIGASLQQLNQFIVTGKFNVQDLEKQFILLGLQLIEQLAIQKIASLLNITTTTAASAGSAAVVSAAWAIPATLVSVATEGEADIVGQTALLEAMGTIQGAAIVGFEPGGYTGHGDRKKIAGVVHGREYVFSADETAALGVPFLEGLAAAAGGRAITKGPSGILTPAPGIHPLPAVDPFSPTSSMQDKFGRGPALAGYDTGGHVIDPGGHGVPGSGSFHYISPSQFGNNPGAYGIFFDPRSNTYFYYNPSTNQTYWAPVDYSSGGYSDPGVLSGNENNPENWDSRFQSPVVIGAQGDPEVDLHPQWGGGATSDYWAASETWGPYGVGWAYDAQGDPQPMSYFADTGTAPSAGPSGHGAGGIGGFNAPPPDALPPGMNFGNATGVFAIGGPFSTPGAGPQFSSLPGYSFAPGSSVTISGIPGAFLTTPSGQTFSTAIGMFGLGAMNAAGGAGFSLGGGSHDWMEPAYGAKADRGFGDLGAVQDFLDYKHGGFGAYKTWGNPKFYAPSLARNTNLNWGGNAGGHIGHVNNPWLVGYTGPPVPGTPYWTGTGYVIPPANPLSWTSSDPALIGPTTGALLFDDLKKHDGGGIDERVVIAQVGEFMMQRRAAQHYGPQVMHAINTMQIPLEHLRYHAGGEIDDMGALLDTSFYSSPDSKSGGVRRLPPPVEVYVYHDVREALKDYHDSSSFTKQFIKTRAKALR